MESSQQLLLQPEWAEDKKKTQLWLWGLTIGAFFSFTLLLLSIYFVNREVNARQEVEAKLAGYQEDLRSLASQLSLAEERERRRIAAHLHDDIGQSMSLATIKLRELQKSLATASPETSTAEMDRIGGLMEQAIRDTQSLTFKISSPLLYELGLEAALDWLAEQFQKQQGIAAHFEADDRPKPLAEDVGVLLFQAVNELLVNVARHARARRVRISLRRDDAQLKVRVADDGVGFNASKTGVRRRENSGFGLFSIRERLRPFGGCLDIQSKPGLGTQVTLSVPLPEAD
jgi:signal transduction histidine kinase